MATTDATPNPGRLPEALDPEFLPAIVRCYSASSSTNSASSLKRNPTRLTGLPQRLPTPTPQDPRRHPQLLSPQDRAGTFRTGREVPTEREGAGAVTDGAVPASAAGESGRSPRRCAQRVSARAASATSLRPGESVPPAGDPGLVWLLVHWRSSGPGSGSTLATSRSEWVRS